MCVTLSFLFSLFSLQLHHLNSFLPFCLFLPLSHYRHMFLFASSYFFLSSLSFPSCSHQLHNALLPIFSFPSLHHGHFTYRISASLILSSYSSRQPPLFPLFASIPLPFPHCSQLASGTPYSPLPSFLLLPITTACSLPLPSPSFSFLHFPFQNERQ